VSFFFDFTSKNYTFRVLEINYPAKTRYLNDECDSMTGALMSGVIKQGMLICFS